MESALLIIQLPFLRDALLAAVAVATACALLSPFLVMKGYSLIGDAIAHAVLPGIALAYIAGLPLILGAFVAGMGSAVLTGWLDTHSRVKRDTLMGVVFAGMFAIGIVLISGIPTDVHLDHILFGNLLGVGPADLATGWSVAGIITLIMGFRWRDYLLHAFDEVQARAVGLPVAAMTYGLLAMISAAVVAALGAVGIILVIALLITPGAIGFLLARSFGAMILVSLTAALSACVIGMWLSVMLDSAPAATIVLFLTAEFLMALAWRRAKPAGPQRNA